MCAQQVDTKTGKLVSNWFEQSSRIITGADFFRVHNLQFNPDGSFKSPRVLTRLRKLSGNVRGDSDDNDKPRQNQSCRKKSSVA
jgi:hypothetical protein